MGEKTAKKKGVLSVKTMMIYGLGIFGLQAGIGLVNSYQAEFFNKNFGANLMAVAAIILAAKFFSIIADFIIGNLIDRSKLKGGKMRPWIFISAFPFVVLTMVMFVVIPFNSVAAKYVYIVFITIMWNVSMSLADIPSQGMLALLSPDAEERNNAAGFANTFKSVGLACPGVFATIVCMMTGSEAVGRKEYLILAGLVAGVGFLLYMLIYFCCKERVVSAPSSTMSFREMFRELKNNKLILIVFLTFILGFGRTIGLSIGVQACTILMREGVNIPIIGYSTGDKISWLPGLTSAITSMIIVVTVPMINKKWGEKKTFNVFAIYGFVVALINFLLYAYAGPIFRTIGAILIYQAFLGFAFGPNGYLPMVMTSDIVDYGEWKTGKRTEGTQFAILSLSNKLSNALSIAIGIFLVGAIGYSSEAYYANIAAAGGTSNIASYITDSMQTDLFAIYMLLPGICCLLSMIPMFWYKIDEKTKRLMRADLSARRAAEAAACAGSAEDGGACVECTTDLPDAADGEDDNG